VQCSFKDSVQKVLFSNVTLEERPEEARARDQPQQRPCGRSMLEVLRRDREEPGAYDRE